MNYKKFGNNMEDGFPQVNFQIHKKKKLVFSKIKLNQETFNKEVLVIAI